MQQYIKKDDFETVQLDQEWIIMNTNQFTVTKLNEIGGFCWSLLEEPQTINALTQSVRVQFDIDQVNLSNHIYEFLQELMEYGLIQHAV
ncbi:PqqD family protein [Metabacillus halosaccharovorans]|uniref:PqqD family protein n=1 Tax=Metabacillus halosaccharovorans TaxID=930124 RepID=UPI001C1F42B2|nr:PqqD family protein [Metabacillus halosaccharovorans]MBU7593498.1 PqqD family protein [Metabacillus halosaccharovorans]